MDLFRGCHSGHASFDAKIGEQFMSKEHGCCFQYFVLNLVGDVLDTLWSVRYVGLLHTASFTGRP